MNIGFVAVVVVVGVVVVVVIGDVTIVVAVVSDAIVSVPPLLESLSLNSVVNAVNGGVVDVEIGVVSAMVGTVRRVL